jgi:hypothetical protein
VTEHSVVPRWRRAIGTVLVLAPLFVLIDYCLTAVLIGSLGMDIHIHRASKTAFYVAVTSFLLFALYLYRDRRSVAKTPESLNQGQICER